MDLAIETSNLTKKYGSLIAVNKLNLQVERNTIHGFLGPNGAGKSTTIKILVGLLKPDGGTVEVLGQQIHGDNPNVRMRVGYMPELPKFPKHLKAWELMDLYGKMYGMTSQKRKEQIPKLLETVGLSGRERELIGGYSKGMQQRIGIAQALLNEPELVILDEPSLGLDPIGMVEMRALIKEIAKEGMTVFISSHLLFEVEQICSHITIINRGVSLVSDTLQNVSHKLAGFGTLQIEVVNISDAIIDAVKTMPFVSSVSQENNTLIIELKTRDDVRTQVSQTITNSGGTIISMNVKGQSLEEVFMHLISNSNEGKKQ